LAKTHLSLGVGLHFNITEGRPIADPARIRGLLGANGEFFGSSTQLANRAMLGRLREEEVMIELRAQIERAMSAGIKLTHVDSHKHAHALPPICRVIARTIREYGVGAMRLPRERWRFEPRPDSLKLLGQSARAFALSQVCRTSETALRQTNVKTTASFFGVTRTGFWSRRWLIGLIERLPDGSCELMCHPGYDDDELRGVKTRLRKSRENELRLLTHPDVALKLKEQGVRLINFSDL
jgi:predicted glycoside hydrolase/deacetylase ChbG (UPF0249 family)